MEPGDPCAAAAAVWNRKADFWDGRMGEGNDWHLHLVRPAVERLLRLQPGERVLEVGCGNGLLARRLADMGAEVVAGDVSPRMVELARARGDRGGRIVYRVLDATDPAQLAALGAGAFSAAVAAMVLMDLPALGPLARGLAGALAAGGRCVFAVSHPCFHTTGTSLVAEEVLGPDGRTALEHSVRVRRYRSLAPARGEALAGQPERSGISTGP